LPLTVLGITQPVTKISQLQWLSSRSNIQKAIAEPLSQRPLQGLPFRDAWQASSHRAWFRFWSPGQLRHLPPSRRRPLCPSALAHSFNPILNILIDLLKLGDVFIAGFPIASAIHLQQSAHNATEAVRIKF